uniref:Prostaglandin E synthase 2 n=1 Tax=Globisporangium ultimum (strain ATCC 200006 / CBS 805.95 / DAOM BR144) TaxID=431595 RepID=K3WFT3_GLOUD
MLHRSVRSASALRGASKRVAAASKRPLNAAAFSSRTSRSVTPAAVSPLLQKTRNAAGLVVAGSTTAVCTYCSAAAPAAAPVVEAPRSLPKVTLYQYEPCPYCCKVKAVLDYLRIPYDVIEVNPLTKKETKPLTDYKKVPVCTINDEVIVDSSAIISRLRELVLDPNENKSEATGGVSFEEEEKWRKWVDEKLILLAPPNIYRTFPESLQSFDYCLTEGKFTATERYMSKYAGAVAMYFIAKKLKTKYDIEDEREALYEAINSYVDAVGDRDFLGGTEPNMADLSVFGVVRSVAGLQTFDDLMQHTSIKPWFTRMTEKVGPTTRVSSA